MIAVVRNCDSTPLYSKFGVVTVTPAPHSRQEVPQPMNGVRSFSLLLAPHEVVLISII